MVRPQLRIPPVALVLCITLVSLASPGVQGGALERLFAPKAKAWSLWSASDASSEVHVDHGPWQAFLDRYLVDGEQGVRLVTYADVSPADRGALDAYIDAMQGMPVHRLSRDQQFAYWVNLYNALTVRLVLAHYPVESIRDIDISPGLFADGPWGKPLATIEGEPVSLNDIEHRILRPLWRDPRVHYALNCASIGCPSLVEEAFDADNADALLEAAAREYVNHPRGARIDGGRLHVSSIYSWFRDDFGGNDAGVIEHLRHYADPSLSPGLEGIRRISGDSYDWSLNDAASDHPG